MNQLRKTTVCVSVVMASILAFAGAWGLIPHIYAGPCYIDITASCPDEYGDITCEQTGDCIDLNGDEPELPPYYVCDTPVGEPHFDPNDLPEREPGSYMNPWWLGPAEVERFIGDGVAPTDEGKSGFDTADDPVPCYFVFRCKCDGWFVDCELDFEENDGWSAENFYEQWTVGDDCPST